MFQIERHDQILQYVNTVKKTTTEQMAEKFQVSKATIRRDVDLLDRNGLLKKVHGGAVALSDTSLHEIPFAKKVILHTDAKKQIGREAAGQITSGDTIILDAGSTTLEVAKHIDPLCDLTVLTNDLKIAMELSSKNNLKVMMCGGRLDGSVYTLNGDLSVAFFQGIHVNKIFLGCDALDLGFGISDRSYESTNLKKAMIASADEVIMVTDCSKFNKKAFCYLCDISRIHLLITDRMEAEMYQAVTELGVKIILTSGRKS